MKKIILPFCALLATALPVFAEDDVTKIIITGSRTALETENKASTQVLTQADIERSTADSLPELLSQVPGISFDQSGTLGSVSALRIRGTESDHVLVIVDGVRTSSASSGATALQFIPIGQIERIEVLKGPRSGVYGSEAIGGVIQVFTKTGKNSQGGYADVGFGSHNKKTVAAGFNNVTNTFYYGLNIGYLETQGIDSVINSTGANMDSDAFDQQNLSINTGYSTSNDTKFDFKYLTNRGNVEIDSGGENDNSDFKNEVANLDIKTSLAANLELNFNFGYFTDELETFSAFASVFDTQRKSASTFLDYKLSSNQAFILGYEYFNDALESTTNFDVNERDNKAVFTEYSIKTNYADIHLTARSDDNEAFGRENTGSAGITKSINKNHSIGLSYGTGFKAPTFNELFTSTMFFQGDPNLKPETSHSTEISYVGKYNNVRLTAVAYRTEIKNLIENTSNFSTVENINKAKIRGAEISLDGDFSSFSTGLSLSYVDAVNEETGDRLIRRPRSTARFYINKNINKLDLLLVVKGEGNRRQSTTDSTAQTAGYALFDIGAGYEMSKNSSVRFNIKNLLDTEYLLISGFQTFNTEKRTAELSYKYKF